MKMRGLLWLFVGLLCLATSVSAQDYRARVQGQVVDESKGALPGATVTLTNVETGVAVTRVTDAEGRYLVDFVDPGTYALTGELDGFRRAEQTNVRVPQRGDVTVDLTLSVGGLEETVTVEAAPVAVQFNTSSHDITLEKQLLDQVPISGRNPYNLSNLDPSIMVSTTTNENRPYHHAYANDYDAGGGTQRANTVLLDGVSLGASFKTAYTPAVDAIEEVTVSKNSVDAENGNSLGGVISLNMKSGTNSFKGSAYFYGRNPEFNAIADPTLKLTPGQDTSKLKGTDLKMYGGTLGGPIVRNKVFSFSSFEQWDDKRPLTIVRTVPTALERAGDFSQSLQGGRVRTIYNPFSSVLDPATNRVVRTPFAGNVIPSALFDPVALKMLQDLPLPNLPGNTDNWQGGVDEKVDYWNFSQRVDWNVTDTFKMFARYGQFKADLYQQNPTDAGFFPLSGSNRDGMSFAGDAVWVMSDRTTLNVRGSYYNMVDEFYNPSLLLGEEGLADYWGNNHGTQSLYNSGYVYYPALDVTSGTGTSDDEPAGPAGTRVVSAPGCVDGVGADEPLPGGAQPEVGRRDAGVLRRGGAIRADQPGVQLDADGELSDSPDVVNTGNQWATFMLGALDGQTSARLVPLQTTNLRGYAAYVQDDYRINDRLTLNLGLRWEYEPGPTDPENRLSQRLDLTSPIPEMQTTPPPMNAQALALMASKGYGYTYNGAWVFADDDDPHAWHSTWKNFLPRVGRELPPGRGRGAAGRRMRGTRCRSATCATRWATSSNQYAGYAQTTNTLGLATGRPQQTAGQPVSRPTTR